MSPTVTSRCFCALLAFFAVAAALGAPMSDEDVVRLYVSGAGVDQIIDRIEESDAAFDLSDEMLDELRAAGLPAAVIEAMIARQAEIDDASTPAAVVMPAAESSLRIRVNRGSDHNQPGPLRVLDLIDEPTYNRLRLRTADPQFTDMAIFVACRTQDHVPDQWRGKSPLGRDYISVQRHRMLHFHPGAEPAALGGFKKLLKLYRRPDGTAPMVLELELPAEIEIELEPGIAHDLTIGVALRAEDRFYLIAFDELDGVVLHEEGLAVDAIIRNGMDLMYSSLRIRLGD